MHDPIALFIQAPRRPPAGCPRMRALSLAILASVAIADAPVSIAEQDRPDWDHDWIALTVARNGAWGTAADANLTRAMVRAIAECRRRSGQTASDCGAEITTVRNAWSIAYLCGDQYLIANGDTAADARLAAIERALDLQAVVGADLPPCELLVAVDPAGQAAPSRENRESLALPRSNR